jgi:hypothetical protein
MAAKVIRSDEERQAIAKATKPVDTLEQAQANDPRAKGYHLFTVTHQSSGKKSFVWARDHGGALIYMARHVGFTAAAHGKAPTPEKVGQLFAALSPEERAALLQQYLPGKKGGK